MSSAVAEYASNNPYRRDHVPTLDGLRGIAVLLVLWAHLPIDSLPWLVNVARFAFQPGYFGVDIFFVLSGFLITRILLVDKHSGRPLKLFLMRRFLRIFPIYYLTILALLFLEPGMYLLWSALYVSNFTFSFDLTQNPLRHTWSLAVEEHFYLVWPFIVYGCSTRMSRRLAAVVLMPLAVVLTVVVLAFSEAWFMGHGGDLIYRGSPFRALTLLAGAMIAYHEKFLREKLNRLARIIVCLAVAGCLVLPVGLVVDQAWVPLPKLIGYACLSTSVVLLAIRQFDVEGFGFKPLSAALLCYIGRISYGVYLYHFPIFYYLGLRGVAYSVVQGSEPPQWYLLAGGVAATFVVATVSFYVIERPLLKLKDRFH